ncbi:MAG: hypothetical protein HXY38_09120 [Chloroflexi bacterium]|nr:hypothetical protein [Chloroflexota bacterium]
MLNLVLKEIAGANEPISLTVLSNKLAIEQSALEGMLAHWVRKGKLRDDDAEESSACGTGGTGGCGCACTGTDACAFVAKMPKTYSLSSGIKKDNAENTQSR